MNTTATRLTHTVMIAAALAAFVMIQPAKAAPAVDATAVSGTSAAIVMLPRVTITAKRVQATEIVHLPRVMVTAKRADSNELMQARKEAAPAAMLVALR